MNRNILLLITFILIVAVVTVRVGGLRKKHAVEKQLDQAKTEASTKPAVKPDLLPVKVPHALRVHPEIKVIPKMTVKADDVQIPQSLHSIFGLGVQKDYMTRIKAVHKLGKNLTESEIKALYVFLNRKNSEDNLKPSEIDAIKNDVSVLIMQQQKKPADYGNNLMAMYFDKSHDDVWRDYCIQHLGGWYSKTDVADRNLIAGTLWKAAEEKNLSIAGTALIALSNNTGNQDISKEDVADKAYELCEDAQCGELAKITALQICAKLDDKRVLPTARKIAESGASVPLKMSAIAAVGTLGDSSDKPMLEKYASSSDTRLRKSAQSALGRLK